ncbi:MAG: radical SAM family heme chaperone HemW [Cyanobacteria bacterium SIG32]|nr:radical SAM family heme chaperone HemW [Cyanobacteria bacterium SIG32]
MATSVYIHIPFCKSKCKYCSFVSFPTLEKKQEYLDALKKEISHYYKNEQLRTLYFGGGTPSLLAVNEFEELLKLFNINSDTEITVELNPETLTQEYLNGLKSIGINRISLGCQTFNDEILKLIGRRHNSQQVKNAINFAKTAGFKNISIDFIYGLPTQTLEDFANDLKQALQLEVQHISLYGLKIDEGCYFYNHIPDNLPNEDTQADMYLKAIEFLSNFNHYEVSNFGKPSQHNLNYWDNKNYYGFGVAAHGYIDNVRYSNTETIENYIQTPTKHAYETELTKQEQLEEEIFLGLRKMSGLNIQDINKTYNIDFETKYANILKKYDEYFTKTEYGYKFNIQGILISNSILSEFLE